MIRQISIVALIVAGGALVAGAQDRGGRVPVIDSIAPASPGKMLTVNYACSYGAKECARLATPTKACVSPIRGGLCARELHFAPSFGARTLTMQFDDSINAGEWVGIEYGEKNNPRHAWAPVLPPSADANCCDFLRDGDLNVLDWHSIVAVIALPVDLDVTLMITTKTGIKRQFTFSHVLVPPGPQGYLWTPFPPSASNDLLKGAGVVITVRVDGVATEVANGAMPDPSAAMPPPPAPAPSPVALAWPAAPAAPAPPDPLPQPPVVSPCQAAALGNCAAPLPQTTLGLDDTVSFILGCIPRQLSDLTFCRNNQPEAVTWSLTSMAPLTYTAKLMSKLKDGQMVKAIQVDQNVYESSAQKATAPAVLKPPTFVQTVTEGSTTVSGLATGLDSVRVELKDGRDVKTFADATPDAKGAFTATFTNPLQADQHLEVFGLSKSGAMSADSVGVDVGSYGLDWGLVRGYFTAGVLMSNNNSQFNLTSANLFLGFNLDKDWPRIVQPKFDSTRYSRVSFHTFFDTRLTAIPTGTSNASGTTPTATGGTGSTTTTGTSTTSTSNLTSLFSNNQAASLQVGAYFPITAGAWDYKDQSYSLFVAPLAKVGFYTVTNAGSTASQALTNSLNAGRFFPFYGYGLRIGHYRNYKWRDGLIDRSRAPEQLSYIDFTVGKWANFETLSPYNFNGAAMPTCTVPTSDPATAACDVRQRLWRYGFEGILVIPNTPLILGLSANVSAQRPHSSTGIYLLPQDDLRFLFGIRFDANRLTGILSKFGVQ